MSRRLPSQISRPLCLFHDIYCGLYQLNLSPIEQNINVFKLNRWVRFIKNNNENIHTLSHTIFPNTASLFVEIIIFIVHSNL